MENDLMERDNSFCGNFNFRKFCWCRRRRRRCCYLFIYTDRREIHDTHIRSRTCSSHSNKPHTMQWFQRFCCATHGLMVVEMFCFVLFFSSRRGSAVLRFFSLLFVPYEPFSSWKISTNAHTIHIEYHNKYFSKRKCFLPTALTVHRAHNIRGILINCFKNDGWSSNVINASSRQCLSPEYAAWQILCATMDWQSEKKRKERRKERKKSEVQKKGESKREREQERERSDVFNLNLIIFHWQSAIGLVFRLCATFSYCKVKQQWAALM